MPKWNAKWPHPTAGECHSTCRRKQICKRTCKAHFHKVFCFCFVAVCCWGCARYSYKLFGDRVDHKNVRCRRCCLALQWQQLPQFRLWSFSRLRNSLRPRISFSVHAVAAATTAIQLASLAAVFSAMKCHRLATENVIRVTTCGFGAVNVVVVIGQWLLCPIAKILVRAQIK